nr:MAG TPA_asm: hypothetical protein [Bacteriophage sp.]
MIYANTSLSPPNLSETASSHSYTSLVIYPLSQSFS